MKSSDLVKRIAEISGADAEEVSEMFDAFEIALTDALLNGESVTIKGICKVGMRRRKERTIVNPKTGKLSSINEAMVPYFRASKRLISKLVASGQIIAELQDGEEE